MCDILTLPIYIMIIKFSTSALFQCFFTAFVYASGEIEKSKARVSITEQVVKALKLLRLIREYQKAMNVLTS